MPDLYYHSVKNKPAYVFNRYKVGAKKRGIAFKISYEDFLFFIWGQPCHYCGDTPIKIGIDRVNNKRGYSLDNVVSCCTTCNFMKARLHREVFLNQCRKVAAHFK